MKLVAAVSHGIVHCCYLRFGIYQTLGSHQHLQYPINYMEFFNKVKKLLNSNDINKGFNHDLFNYLSQKAFLGEL
jgi:hypothetical protein